jgi:hypothetical protein
MLKYIIGGVVLVLMAIGGFINYNRERSGECSEQYVKDYLRPELVEKYLGDSAFYANLSAGLKDDRVSAGSRADLQAQKDRIDSDLENKPLESREVSPSTRTQKTCLTRLPFDTGFIEARYNLSTDPMPGNEFEEKYAKRRKNIILRQELEAGKTYDSIEVSVFSRRSFYLQEKPLPDIIYSAAFTPEEGISGGIVSDIPK